MSSMMTLMKGEIFVLLLLHLASEGFGALVQSIKFPTGIEYLCLSDGGKPIHNCTFQVTEFQQANGIILGISLKQKFVINKLNKKGDDECRLRLPLVEPNKIVRQINCSLYVEEAGRVLLKTAVTEVIPNNLGGTTESTIITPALGHHSVLLIVILLMVVALSIPVIYCWRCRRKNQQIPPLMPEVRQSAFYYEISNPEQDPEYSSPYDQSYIYCTENSIACEYEEPLKNDNSTPIKISSLEFFILEAAKSDLFSEHFRKNESCEEREVFQRHQDIDANWIDGHKKSKMYMAAGSVPEEKVCHFLNVVLQEEVTLIISMDSKINSFSLTGAYQGILVITDFVEKFTDVTISHLTVRYKNIEQKVLHVQYFVQSDLHSFTGVQSLANFANQMARIESAAPIIVQSSDDSLLGIFILVDSNLKLAQSDGFVDPLAMMTHLRTQRPKMMEEQLNYRLVHLVLLEVLTAPRSAMNCADFVKKYDNIKKVELFEAINAVCKRDAKVLNQEIILDPKICRFPKLTSATCESSVVTIQPDAITENQKITTNCVFVDGFGVKSQFIAAQVPMEGAVAHFWCLVKQNHVKQIVILNEDMPNQEEFLPSEGRVLIFPGMMVAIEGSQELGNYQLISCTIKLDKKPATRITIYKLNGWEYGKKALDTKFLVTLWEEVSRNAANSLVVCYDGVSACGIFLAIGLLLEKIKLEQQVDVAFAVRALRRVRPTFVPNAAQFQILHEAALLFLKAHNIYSNFQCG